jgi:phosphate-selective porin
MKTKGKAPKNPIGHGFGAVELTARYDVLAFSSAPGPGLPSRSPRAPTILPNNERTWTAGPNWYLNRFVKIQINGQRQRLTDIEKNAVLGRNKFYTGVIRLEITM